MKQDQGKFTRWYATAFTRVKPDVPGSVDQDLYLAYSGAWMPDFDFASLAPSEDAIKAQVDYANPLDYDVFTVVIRKVDCQHNGFDPGTIITPTSVATLAKA